MKFPREGLDLRNCMHNFERSLLIQALRAAKGNVTQAARLLFVTRQTIYNLLKKHELRADKASGLN